MKDIELGISQSRNPKLANVLYRLKWIESYGTGLQRMIESYKNSASKPFWQVAPNAFVVTLPKQVLSTSLDEDAELQKWLDFNLEFISKELEGYLNKNKGTVRKVIEQLLQHNRIERVGNGPATKYRVKVE